MNLSTFRGVTSYEPQYVVGRVFDSDGGEKFSFLCKPPASTILTSSRVWQLERFRPSVQIAPQGIIIVTTTVKRTLIEEDNMNQTTFHRYWLDLSGFCGDGHACQVCPCGGDSI